MTSEKKISLYKTKLKNNCKSWSHLKQSLKEKCLFNLRICAETQAVSVDSALRDKYL